MSAEAKHTPGPWRSEGYYVRQNGENGTRMIADVCYTGPHHTPPGEYPMSCRLADEANARLIASAPELLEALKKFIRAYDSADWLDDNDVESFRAVIAKAEGRIE